MMSARSNSEHTGLAYNLKYRVGRQSNGDAGAHPPNRRRPEI